MAENFLSPQSVRRIKNRVREASSEYLGVGGEHMVSGVAVGKHCVFGGTQGGF